MGTFQNAMLQVVPALCLIAATAVGTWLANKIGRATDGGRTATRAMLLEKIAMAAAALVVSLNPGATWAVLLEQVVKQIGAAAGVPTQNANAIERAAAAALTALGKNPGAK